MTIKEKLFALRKDFTLKTDTYFKADKRLFDEGNGFFDNKLLTDLADAKEAWQKAGNAYNSLLSHVLNNRLNVDAEID
ncbi:hypothetical protein [Sphingobacterium daejeonense]|uniref:hypothetical protein n=1 Tax=Sphingobacterium daejeonense TaxID=371142 RepID=UPI003D30FCE0